MALEAGLVGLPNAGKSTLFNALTRAAAEAAPYPFTTVDPNVGVVPIPDPRLERVGELCGQERRVPATLEVVDIAGLVEGAHRGEGLGNRFLARIREVDVVLHVVRCFEAGDVAHPLGRVDPLAELRIVDAELAARDLESVRKRLETEAPAARSGDREAADRVRELETLAAALEAGRPARSVARPPEGDVRDELFLLTQKPEIVVANVSEYCLPDGGAEAAPLREALAEPGDGRSLVAVSARIEAELAELGADDPSEAEAFRDELGVRGDALDRMVAAAFAALDQVTFFTVDGPEARAWLAPRNCPVAQAVEQIHTDFRERFVRAEVLAYEDLLEHGSRAAARDAGRVRTVGRDHPVGDGNVVHVLV